VLGWCSETNSPEALYYYQRSLLQYHEHYAYRDLYANSGEPLLVLDQFGSVVLDCNGAALHFFGAQSRSQVHPWNN
jgi:PAS domain-containing protein